ncbi:SH3 domain-containing protein, partial [Escherichia coli]|uniref:SH3 domain-containing protein n=1 Tax=Escherichia coli TaxID=562 RepID=UPI003CE50575
GSLSSQIKHSPGNPGRFKDNWFYCTIPGHTGGWVPGQILERCEGTYRGIAREDYNARELEVKRGDEVYGLKSLNGWMWCERTSNGQAGWMGSPVAAA